MRANKYLLLFSSLGTLLILLWAAYHEHYRQDWRQVQREVRAQMVPERANAFEIQLRQVVAPDLGATDRCVSCHVGMAAGETGVEGSRIYGKHANVFHDPASYGCTVCHGGQPRATSTKDAHGDVPHWPEPMIPEHYAYAGCGSCHTHVSVPNATTYKRGRSLFERYDCLACHRMDNRGGTFRPGGAGGQEGPDLSAIGVRGFDSNWYEGHRKKHLEALAGPWVTAFGGIEKKDREAIDVYLSSRVGAPGLVESKALFHSLGCRGCHKVGGVGGDDGPDLTTIGQKDPAQTPFANVSEPHTMENWFEEHFRNPGRVVEGSQMPTLGLTEEEIDQLTFYMFSLRRGSFPEALWPQDRIRAERFGVREFTTDGATIYGTFCASCHGPALEGMRYPGASPFPAIGNPDFLRIVSDEFLIENVRRGRPGRRMPAWGENEGGLRPTEIDAVVQYVRETGGIEFRGDPHPPRWIQGDSALGKALYQKNCALCHGENGNGKEGPAVSNRVFLELATDTYLLETIRTGRRGTTMNGFGEGSTVRQALTENEMEAIVAFIRTWEEQK